VKAAEIAIEAVAARLRGAGCVFAEDEAELLIEAASADGGPTDGRPTDGGPAGGRPADGRLVAASAARLEELVARRCGGEPLEQVVGWAAFCGVRIEVGPGVFVPRRRSEFLVETALATGPDAAVVLDLCCGVAPFATALAVRLPAAEIHAADIDPTQTVYARRNLAPFGGRARVYEGDLYSPLPGRLRRTVDLLVVNAPYVPTSAIATLPAEARAYEPITSLDGGSDGLDLHRRIAAGAPEWLAPGGHVLIETSDEQADTAVAAFRHAGLDVSVVEDDDLEATVVVGRQP
jgi:release factor glutamine methyltransferase